MASALEVLADNGDAGIHALFEAGEGFGNRAVQRDHRAGTVGLAAYGTELEAIASEGKGARAVAVGVVDK